MSSDSLLALSAVELRRLIGTKAISPVELLDACITRIDALNPAVNAIAAKGYTRARQEAKAAEAAVLAGEDLPPLHGLPLGVKDLQDTEGLLTTHGSPLYRDNVPKRDSAQIALVRKAGAIVTAKTNVPEFGAGANSRNPVWGATGNPFNPSLNAGGSSGGSAAALACDMLPICTGSDTGGSLRIPAAICGIVGYRPSPGLVPMDGRGLGWTPISVLGPMGRDVADTRLLFGAQLGVDDRDPLSQPLDAAAASASRPLDLSRLRVAWTTDFGQCPVASDIKQVMRARMKAMSHLFLSCDEIDVDFGEADRMFDVIRAQSYVARYKHSYDTEREKLGPNIVANYELGAAMTMADAAWAHTEQTNLFRRFQALYQDYDLIIAPTTPVSPFPWTQLYLTEMEGQKLRNYYHWLSLTYFITLVTNPAISLPCGVDANGMPFGLQIIGRFRGDLELLDAAQAMESAFTAIPGLARPKPDLAKLATARPDLKSIVTAPPVEAE
ncbi:MAG: amidase [Alphaproteobacteria bacterium]|nr:amidase [Alphaproteobacteria bacterium]MBU0798748.1 amidase [Alphaproteobacteria bacterium]MBU0886011.1 amidase [Alphaproteobacteria bacterium]MBU1812000.1 amidase [Alphaproteobacteria bacterium]MBU2091211.1 amidase [Alphaproteobacteria bacterium]